MVIRIRRRKPGGIFISDAEDKLTSTITELDLAILQQNEEEANREADAAYEAHAFATADRIGTEVADDIRHHFQKFGPQRLDGFNWIAVVTEEWGETVAAYNQQNYEAVIKEGKQAIACIMRLIVEVEREMTGANVMERERYGRAQ
jgi:hypothetical protein